MSKDFTDDIEMFLKMPENTPEPEPMSKAEIIKIEAALTDSAEEMVRAWDEGKSLPFVDIAPKFGNDFQKMVTSTITKLPFEHPGVRHGPCVIAVNVCRLLTITHPELGEIIRNTASDTEIDPETYMHMNNCVQQMCRDLDRYDAERRVWLLGGIGQHQEQVGVSMGVMFVKYGPERVIRSAMEVNTVFWADNRDPVTYYQQWDDMNEAPQPAMAN